MTTIELLTAEEVASMLRISVRSLKKWAREGNFPCVKVGRERRYRLHEIVAYIERERKE